MLVGYSDCILDQQPLDVFGFVSLLHMVIISNRENQTQSIAAKPSTLNTICDGWDSFPHD